MLLLDRPIASEITFLKQKLYTAAARWAVVWLGLSTTLVHTELSQQLLDGLL